jgi:flagellar M-ring protein FliF
MTDLTTSTSVSPAQQPGMLPTIGTGFQRAGSFYRQPSVQRALPSIAAAIVAIVGIILYVALQSPERTTLFSSLSEGEKSRVFDALKNGGVDVKIDSVTGELTVPVDDYHSAKLNLAAQGIPMQVADGYSSLDNMPMGTSRSVETLKIKQSLEYELARSVTEIETIKNARVHLAIPERSAFARNTQQPSASVFVELGAGRALGSLQVEAIVNLVASSVPNLPKSKVSIVDQSGRLLSNAVHDAASTASELQFQYRMRIEELYRTRVESLLTPIVGPGNVSSQVNIDIDFTSLEVTEDRVLPDDVALLSQQISRDQQVSKRAKGIPGAMSNEPPAQSEFLPINEMETGQQDQTAATAENAVTDAAGNAVTAKSNDGKEVSKYSKSKALDDGSGSTMVSSNEVQNYEVSRQISTRKMPSTEIRKVTVAVLLREQSMVAPNGEVQTLAISDKEKTEIKELVSSALGLTPERGDIVIISSRPFMTKIVDGIAKNWYEESWVRDLMSKSLMLLIISVVSLAVIRPLLSRLLTPSQDSLKTAYIEENVDDLENMELGEGQSLEDLKAKLKPKKTAISAEMLDTANSYDDKVAIIRMMVSDESGRVANVFKAMMQNETDFIQ